MNEKELINKHKEIFDFLLEYKKEHNDFVFLPRKKHNDIENNHLNCRLCKGYIFQGNENYIFVPLYKKVDTSNHTQTIGFVYTEHKQYIEIVFSNIQGDEKTFYDEINEYLRKSNKVSSEIKINNHKFQYILNELLEKNLLYFISDVKNKIDSLIIKYGLENKYFISEKEFQDLINKMGIKIELIKDKEDTMKTNLKTKNIMFYGAPGVGKTYNYKKLVSLIESEKYSENSIFNAIIKNEDLDTNIDKTFEKIKKENRLEFVTFHQSYSYEDFIEGFRPQDDGSISLETGIFKKLCEKARENLENSQIKEDDKLLDLDELIQKFTNYVQDSLDKENAFFIDEKITIENINNRGAFVLGGSIKSDTQRLTPDIIKRDYQLFKNKEITRYEDIKPTRESKSSYHGNARYYFMLYKKIREFEKTLNTNTIIKQKEEQKNYYIVIDEINRGNISKIFGELITLIEEDKRDIYEVTLPYSKDDIKFTIPSNLYIIATMNSTDKSIATIDIALRRRFTFLKMKPNLDLVKYENANKLMKELNIYIKDKLGEDYALGHSYFMNVENEEDLEFVKEYKIKSLLEEYFYGDDEKYKEALKILNIKE